MDVKIVSIIIACICSFFINIANALQNIYKFAVTAYLSREKN